jgi:hypothetical protein
MPRGYRCIILAAFGWLILAQALPKQGEAANRHDPVAQRQIANSLQSIASSLEKANEPKREDADCSPGSDDRKSDLCAQWKAADATATANTIGYLGLAIGAATLAAAVAAAWFAKRAAEHTRDGASIALRQLELTYKPWLNITPILPLVNKAQFDGWYGEGEWEVRDEPYRFRISTGIKISNESEMPAILTAQIIALFDSPEPTRASAIMNYQLSGHGEAYLSPGGDGASDEPSTSVIGEHVLPARHRLWLVEPPTVWGKLRYKDAMGSEWEMGFAFQPSDLTSEHYRVVGDHRLNYVRKLNGDEEFNHSPPPEEGPA